MKFSNVLKTVQSGFPVSFPAYGLDEANLVAIVKAAVEMEVDVTITNSAALSEDKLSKVAEIADAKDYVFFDFNE